MYSAVYGKTEKIIEILPYSSRRGVGRNVFGSLRETGKMDGDRGSLDYYDQPYTGRGGAGLVFSYACPRE